MALETQDLLNKGEIEFISLLEKARQLCLPELENMKIGINSTKFENLVLEKMGEAAQGSPNFEIRRTDSVHGFPDIIVIRKNGKEKRYGIEVKITDKDKWVSTGNSILESIRESGVEMIYLFFGKFGGVPDIKYRKYQECLKGVTVTHSPRYQINMELDVGGTIFDEMGADYDTIRQHDPIGQVKKFLRTKLKPGQEVWWLDSSEETEGPAVLRQYRDLDTTDRSKFKVEAFILFPELFSISQNKFVRAAAYLTAHYNVYSRNFRDEFTAGGQCEMKIKGSLNKFSHMLCDLHDCAQQINNHINVIPEEELKAYWGMTTINASRIEQWRGLIDCQEHDLPSGLKPSDVFEDGLTQRTE